MDIRYFVDRGVSLDDVLDKVKREYAAESKKKNEENKRMAEAEKLKRKSARTALMKAWRDYTLVVAKDITPADADKLLNEIEENLEAFEETIAMFDRVAGMRKPADSAVKKQSDEEKLKDFLRNLENLI